MTSEALRIYLLDLKHDMDINAMIRALVNTAIIVLLIASYIGSHFTHPGAVVFFTVFFLVLLLCIRAFSYSENKENIKQLEKLARDACH